MNSIKITEGQKLTLEQVLAIQAKHPDAKAYQPENCKKLADVARFDELEFTCEDIFVVESFEHSDTGTRCVILTIACDDWKIGSFPAKSEGFGVWVAEV